MRRPGGCGGSDGTATAHGRVCPAPRTRYLNEVSCSTPTGPRACMSPVAMPISAPKPNSPPSANWVEALWSTIAESTSARKRSAAAGSAATIDTGWGAPWGSRGGTGGDDRLGMRRAVGLGVGDGGVKPVHHLGGDDGVEVFGRPILLGR